jgi:hypothetical protein
MTYDRKRGNLVLFGGGEPGLCFECDATWIWDGISWAQLKPQTSPPGRTSAAFAYDETRQNSVLFGSPSQVHPYLNDTWTWDGKNWTEQHPTISPPARGGADNIRLVYDPRHKDIVLFGGCTLDPLHNGVTVCFDDTWLWDGQNWSRARPTSSPPPLEGIPSEVAYDRTHQYAVLHAGIATWTWDGANWQRRSPAHSPEVPFYGTMGYDEINHQLILVGQNLAGAAQTWIWDGKDWMQVATDLQLGMGSDPYLFFDTKHAALLLLVTYTSKAGITGSSMWIWHGDNWNRIY